MVESTIKESQRTLTGRVVSNSMDKTITVLIERKVKHPIYGKILKRSTKVHAHDADNACNEGDLVTVAQCRPISKSKTWTLVTIDEQSKNL